MLSFDEALARILNRTRTLGCERVGIESALDRVLAERVHASTPLPAFAASAMDGYAVRTEDFPGSGPWALPVVGESRAGEPSAALTTSAACRIFTGGVLPEGANAVVIQEEVERQSDVVRISTPPKHGQNVRQRGEDANAGDALLDAGIRLGPFQLGLLAAIGRAEVVVQRRPVVSILCTGSELRARGELERPGSIPESNGVTLAALVRQVGGIARLAPLVGDDLDATTRCISDALAGGTDLLITSGGVSVGDHDVVKTALTAAGAEIDFWKVRIKPGKPLVFGQCGQTLILGLPGNPVSAQVTFCLFGLPLLKRQLGSTRVVPVRRNLELASPLRQKPGRTGLYRVRVQGQRAEPLMNQSSGSVLSMAQADGLAVVPEDSAGLAAGEPVEVMLFSEL